MEDMFSSSLILEKMIAWRFSFKIFLVGVVFHYSDKSNILNMIDIIDNWHLIINPIQGSTPLTSYSNSRTLLPSCCWKCQIVYLERKQLPQEYLYILGHYVYIPMWLALHLKIINLPSVPSPHDHPLRWRPTFSPRCIFEEVEKIIKFV